tara:strand:+ start:316 stop:681 length:366 start_codon:yes stop_codon:yes gene_type:complete
MEKGKCSVCHKSFTLTKNKTLRKHGHNLDSRNEGNGHRISDFCKGSNTLPFVSLRKWICFYKGYDIHKNIINDDFEVLKNNYLVIGGIFENQDIVKLCDRKVPLKAISFIDNLTKEERANV